MQLRCMRTAPQLCWCVHSSFCLLPSAAVNPWVTGTEHKQLYTLQVKWTPDRQTAALGARLGW